MNTLEITTLYMQIWYCLRTLDVTRVSTFILKIVMLICGLPSQGQFLQIPISAPHIQSLSASA